MFICSVTLTKEKIALLLAICLMIILLSGVCISFFTSERYDTHSERRGFLEQYGWKTADKPCFKETVTLPKTVEELSADYETLQNRQGFSIVPYLGKTLKKYTYTVTNYPNSPASVYANVLLYRGNIVACEIVCPDFKNGFIEPVIRENVPAGQDVILKEHNHKRGTTL
ncbi:MAG: DUF4830 domain-containing protein [Clostridia bacterium]|nr:DUF4830 domain-containing protein [Clostridia bacterium]